MPDATWKAVERAIAAYVGGTRRGADYGGRDGGKTDIILPGYGLEVKHSARPTWGLLEDAVAQSERNALANEKPLAIIHKKGTPIRDCLVVYRLETFRAWEVGEPEHGDT